MSASKQTPMPDLDDRDVAALTEYMTVLEDVGRAREAESLYSVTTQSGREYLVDAVEGACECDDSFYRRPEGGCKHVRRVRFATGRREIPAWVDRSRVDHADGELEFEQALEWMWAPKSAAGAREVYFGHDVRAQIYLERYFDSVEYNRYQASGTAVSRRVTKAAERAPELDPESVYPHCLRASAATNMIATRDIGVYELCQIMGWSQFSTGQAYLARNSLKTARMLDGV